MTIDPVPPPRQGPRARDLLQELVEKTNPYVYVLQEPQHDKCVFCGAIWSAGTSSQGDLDHHRPDCAWYRAKRFLQPRPEFPPNRSFRRLGLPEDVAEEKRRWFRPPGAMTEEEIRRLRNASPYDAGNRDRWRIVRERFGRRRFR